MPDTEEIAELIAFAQAREMARVEIEKPGFALKLEFSTSDSRPDTLSVPPAAVTVCTCGFGRFVSCAPGSPEPLVPMDTEIAEGAVLGLLQVGALYWPIRSPVSGIVRKIHVEEGALLGFGDAAFEIEPYGSNE